MMRDTIRAMNRLLEPEGVEGVALVASDATVFMSGFDSDAATIVEMTGSARHIFRQTRPRPFLLDLAFQRGRVLVLPVAGTVVWLQTAPDAEAFTIVDAIDPHLRAVEALDLCQSGVLAEPAQAAQEVAPPPLRPARPPLPVAADRAPEASSASPPAMAPLPAALAVLGSAVERALGTLGGPVVRNYLRKSRKRLSATDRSLLDPVEVDLEAQLDADALQDDPATIAALGAWTRTFITQTANVIPEMAGLDLQTLAAEAAPTLEASGFFSPPSPGLRRHG